MNAWKVWIAAAAIALTMLACDVSTSRQIEHLGLDLLDVQMAIIRHDNETSALKRALSESAVQIEQLKRRLAEMCPSEDPERCR